MLVFSTKGKPANADRTIGILQYDRYVKSLWTIPIVILYIADLYLQNIWEKKKREKREEEERLQELRSKEQGTDMK